MTQEDYKHPITPPPELVQQWRVEAANRQYVSLEFDEYIAEEAAQWGADQELKACLKWLDFMGFSDADIERLRAARRPKSPSLKAQALDALGPEPLPETGPTGDTILNMGSIERHRCIRRALEQLDG